MKRLLIFGGSGFVGGNLASMAQLQGWEVSIADRYYRPGLDGVIWKTVDITDRDGVDRVIRAVEPQAVVNVAAIADIDQAEKDQALAWTVNVDGAHAVADRCAARGIKYILFSSDAVFDGRGRDYTEDVPPNPVNYYGYTKAEAEKVVLLACPGAVVIRISLVLGFPVTGGNSFFSALVAKLKTGEPVICPTDEFRTPIDVLTLSECVLELAEINFAGRLHLGATDSISRYALTLKIAQALGFNDALIKPQVSSSNQSGRAARHKNGILNVAMAQHTLKTPLLSTEAGLQRALTEQR